MNRSELHERAAELDRADPLATWRDEFVIPDPQLSYLDGNSLGMPPRATAAALQAVIGDQWAGGLIGSWEHWADLPLVVGDRLAPLIGARPGEVVVHDSVSVNLFQLIHAAIDLRPDRPLVAVDRTDFPTDRYLVADIAARAGRTVHHDLTAEVPWDRVAVAVRSHVDYRTGEVADFAAETRRAHEAGALLIWDLSHSAGVLEVDLHGAGVQLAVGCTYKYLNGGPGAPGFSFVAGELLTSLRSPLPGWFGNDRRFEMGDTYAPRPDVGRLLIGTPGILGLTAADVGIRTTATAGIGPIAAKATALTEFALVGCAALGLDSPTPRDPRRRGGHVSVRHADADRITRAIAERGVLADFRRPDLVRLGCSPLTTRFADVARAVAAVADQITR